MNGQTRWSGATHRIQPPSTEGLLDHLQGVGAFRFGQGSEDIFGLIESCEKIDMSDLRDFAKELARLKVGGAEGRAYGKALRAARIKLIENRYR